MPDALDLNDVSSSFRAVRGEELEKAADVVVVDVCANEQIHRLADARNLPQVVQDVVVESARVARVYEYVGA